MLALYNQKCSNRSILVPTFCGQVGTVLDRVISCFQLGVPTVPSSTREGRAHACAHMCVYLDMDGTDGTSVLINQKSKTYGVPSSLLLGWNGLERLEHRLFFLFRGLYMANEGDLGNDMAQRHLDAALQAHRVVRVVSEDCVECGDSISPERQQATGGTQFCFECASLAEKKGRVYR